MCLSNTSLVVAQELELKDIEVTDKHLRALYLEIESCWRRVARQLGPTSLNNAEIESCSRSNPHQEEEQCYEMLQKWMKKQKGKGKVWDLARALYKSKLEDVVETVYGKKVLQSIRRDLHGEEAVEPEPKKRKT